MSTYFLQRALRSPYKQSVSRDSKPYTLDKFRQREPNEMQAKASTRAPKALSEAGKGPCPGESRFLSLGFALGV